MSASDAKPFGPVQRIAAGVLDVGYVDIGPPGGRAVLLLHGWPYDIHSYADAAPALAAAGYRVIVPYLRGYGATRFRSDDAMRNGQQAVLAVDAIALLDALGVDQAIVAGFDWGARTANVMAALWPERCRAMVSVSGYLIGSQAAGQAPLPPDAEWDWWYQYYFATERGQAGYEAYRHDFARLIWRSASPAWRFDDATFERSAAAFDNPDHVAVVIHNYRWRLGLAADRRADHHARRRRERCAAPRTCRLRRAVHGQVPAPDAYGRHRPQPAARGAGRVRSRDRGSRQPRLKREENRKEMGEMATETTTATAPIADATVEEKINQLRELFGGNLAGADDVGTVHDMRFVFLDNDTRMLFATAYDGDWDAYIDDFATNIPDFLDIIDSAWEGWPGIRSPQAKNYLAKYQVTAEGWYVANDLTVAETRRLKRIGQAADQFLDAIGD